jgi:hypothetical protein
MRPYERAVRHGYVAADLKAMLQLIALCRELHDLIRVNVAVFYEKILQEIHRRIQKFVKNTLEEGHIRAKHQKAALRAILDTLRIVAGKWEVEESPQVTAKKFSDFKRRVLSKTSGVSLEIVQFLRIQIQHLLNPESMFMQPPTKLMRGGKSFHEIDEGHLFKFIDKTFNYINLLTLEETLTFAGDQSCFYFKEMQMSLNGVAQFPVRSSMPFLLCQYALDNYVQPELTEILFYPLSIYNDAAFVALNRHKSSMLFNEIRAESEVCVSTLSVLIGEFTFNAFHTFSVLRQLPHRMTEHLKKSHRWPVSQPYRLRYLLSQNQFFILSTQVALSSLIAPRVDSELNSAVARLFAIGNELGVIASLAIDRVLNIIKETHRMLITEGLPLMRFKDIEKAAKLDIAINCHSSEYLERTVQHLFKVIAREYLLALDPIRLIPFKRLQLPPEPLGKLSLGKILKDALEPTVEFASILHFSTWMSQISDGGLTIIVDHVRESVIMSFRYFLQKYKELAGRLSRINDAPFRETAHSAFSRYASAYKFFLVDAAVLTVLKAMQGIGNLIGVALILDQSLSMRTIHTTHIVRYLRGIQTDDIHPRDELVRLFDAKFSEGMKIFTERPLLLHRDVEQLFLSTALSTFAELFTPEIEIFIEKEIKSQDFTVMTGFAAVWSVLDFVFCMLEAGKEAGFMQYGHGVMVCAALIILATRQGDLAQLLSIGNRMKSHLLTDMTGRIDEHIDHYFTAAQASKAAFDAAMVMIEPTVLAFCHV